MHPGSGPRIGSVSPRTGSPEPREPSRYPWEVLGLGLIALAGDDKYWQCGGSRHPSGVFEIGFRRGNEPQRRWQDRKPERRAFCERAQMAIIGEPSAQGQRALFDDVLGVSAGELPLLE